MFTDPFGANTVIGLSSDSALVRTASAGSYRLLDLSPGKTVRKVDGNTITIGHTLTGKGSARRSRSVLRLDCNVAGVGAVPATTLSAYLVVDSLESASNADRLMVLNAFLGTATGRSPDLSTTLAGAFDRGRFVAGEP